jgi:hypothetical protein
MAPLRPLPLLICGLMGLGLAGCVSAAELYQRDQAVCTGYGFHLGTTEFAQCMQRENLARQYYLSQPMWGPYYGPWAPWGPFP